LGEKQKRILNDFSTTQGGIQDGIQGGIQDGIQ
jgi:hypothetical protein